MELFIRYLAKTDLLPNKFPTKAYDLRIFYILSGKGEFVINGIKSPIEKGSFCYCPTGTEYLPISSKKEPLNFIVINFDLTAENKHIRNTLSPVATSKYNINYGIFSQNDCDLELFKTPFVIPNARFVEELVLSAEKEYKRNTAYANEIAESYLKCALLKLAEYDSQRCNDLYHKITSYIFCNFKEIKSNNDIGKALGYHPFYLSKVIERNSGLTLHRYVRKFRLVKATELLTFTDMSIAEISSEIGISNPNNFCNIFLKEYGVSPSAYRKSINIIKS